MRRANFNAFWSRKLGTVSSPRRKEFNLAGKGTRFWLTNILPVIGTLSREDRLGMGLTVGILIHSLDEGRYRSTLQLELDRKIRSAYSNIWYTSWLALTKSVMTNDTRKTYVTSCPSYSLWFKNFIIGIHKRMCHVVHQDKIVTLEVLYKIVEGLEKKYLVEENDREKKKIVDTVVFVLCIFFIWTKRRGDIKDCVRRIKTCFGRWRNS